jgi:hypothetical protein
LPTPVGFPPVFYDAYVDAWPASPGRIERRDVNIIAIYLIEFNRGGVRRVGASHALVHHYAGS